MMVNKSDLNINDLSTWPIAMTVFFCSIIAFLIFFLLKIFFINNITSQVKSKNIEILKEEDFYEKNKKIVAILPQIRREVKVLEGVRNKLRKILPTEVSMPTLIDNVYIAARNNGIVFGKFTPENDIDSKYYTIKPIVLSANVGYISMASFIEEVTTLKRIMNIDSVSFQIANYNDKLYGVSNLPLTMVAQLRTYIFKDNL